MNKKWLFVMLAGILILSLAACTGTSTPTQTPVPEEPTPAHSEDTDMDTDTEAGHDDDADAADSSESDTDDSGDDEAVIIDAAAIYSARCSSCHGTEREGGGGPPLLPTNLTKDPSAYAETITNGSGQMPAWDGRLSADEINALVEFIMSDSK